MKGTLLTSFIFASFLYCNSQSESLPEWMDDGSGAITFDKHQVVCSTEATKDTTFNALWTGEPIANHQAKIFNFNLIDVSGVAIGVTSMDSFGKEYSTQAFATNGINVVSINALLESGYSNRFFQSGDVVSMLVERTNARLTVTFWHNKRCLGPAFEGVNLSATVSPYLYPLVSFKTKGTVGFEAVETAVLPSIEREADGHDGPFGEWASEHSKMSIKRQGNRALLTVRVWNVMQMSCFINENGIVTNRSPVASTMMAVPAETREEEQRFIKVLEELKSIEVKEDNLQLISDEGIIYMTVMEDEFTPLHTYVLREAQSSEIFM